MLPASLLPNIPFLPAPSSCRIFRILVVKESADKFLNRGGIGILEMPQISQWMEWIEFLLRLAAVLLIELCLAVLKKRKKSQFH